MTTEQQLQKHLQHQKSRPETDVPATPEIFREGVVNRRFYHAEEFELTEEEFRTPNKIFRGLKCKH